MDYLPNHVHMRVELTKEDRIRPYDKRSTMFAYHPNPHVTPSTSVLELQPFGRSMGAWAVL